MNSGSAARSAESGYDSIVLDLFGTLCRWAPRTVTSPALLIFAKSPSRANLNLGSLIRMVDGSDGEVLAHGELSMSGFHEIQRERWILAMEAADIVPNDALIDACAEIMRRRKLELYPDASAFLLEITEMVIPWHICSNASPDVLPKLLALLPAQVAQPISATLSWRVGALKPHTRMYESLRDSLLPGTDLRRTLFIGDRFAPDVEGPLTFGFKAAHLVREIDRRGHAGTVAQQKHFLGEFGGFKSLTQELKP